MSFFHVLAPKKLDRIPIANSMDSACELRFATNEKTIESRFIPPQGFIRKTEAGSFHNYLIHLPLKEYGDNVLTYNGMVKPMENVYCSVIDMDLDPVDLQQCADAVMRLRAEYWFSKKEYQKIHFEYLSDGKPHYFVNYGSDMSYKSFRKYMKTVFNRANTRSLKNELIPVLDKNDIQAGDVFIVAGNPYGHAILVIDVVENMKGEKQFLLAQSYMPAQDTHILINPLCSNNSPWYTIEQVAVETPEWNFNWSDLHRFPQEKA